MAVNQQEVLKPRHFPDLRHLKPEVQRKLVFALFAVATLGIAGTAGYALASESRLPAAAPSLPILPSKGTPTNTPHEIFLPIVVVNGPTESPTTLPSSEPSTNIPTSPEQTGTPTPANTETPTSPPTEEPTNTPPDTSTSTSTETPSPTATSTATRRINTATPLPTPDMNTVEGRQQFLDNYLNSATIEGDKNWIRNSVGYYLVNFPQDKMNPSDFDSIRSNPLIPFVPSYPMQFLEAPGSVIVGNSGIFNDSNGIGKVILDPNFDSYALTTQKARNIVNAAAWAKESWNIVLIWRDIKTGAINPNNLVSKDPNVVNKEIEKYLFTDRKTETVEISILQYWINVETDLKVKQELQDYLNKAIMTFIDFQLSNNVTSDRFGNIAFEIDKRLNDPPIGSEIPLMGLAALGITRKKEPWQNPNRRRRHGNESSF